MKILNGDSFKIKKGERMKRKMNKGRGQERKVRCKSMTGEEGDEQ